MTNPLILNIPHSSIFLPCNSVKYEEELLFMTDWYTEELFSSGVGRPLVFPLSRLVCDIERFRDLSQEPMEEIGMGICYSKTHDLKILSNPDEKHRQYILEHYYDVYHSMLECYVEEALDDFDRALILDCHSFSPVPLPYEPDQNPNRPDICIGTDSFHTPQALIEQTVSFFKDKGFTVKINSPYLGTIVPTSFYKDDERVNSIMIELNRSLYLKDGTTEKNSYFKTLKAFLREYQEMMVDFSYYLSLEP